MVLKGVLKRRASTDRQVPLKKRRTSDVSTASTASMRSTDSVLSNHGQETSDDEPIWQALYQQVVKFHKKHGHTEVPPSNPGLGPFCSEQHLLFRNGRLLSNRRQLLDEIDFFQPKSRYRSWEERYAELVEYKAVYGTTRVPQSYTENSALARWVGYMRDLYKKKQLSQARIDRLNAIDFIWAADKARKMEWDDRLEQLREFKSEHGHTNVPLRYEPNPSLAGWIQTQRSAYKKGRLSDARRDQLVELDFDFTPSAGRSTVWEGRFQQLIRFKEKNGHTEVPQAYHDTKFANWVRSMRFRPLTAERAIKLDSIGFRRNTAQINEEKKQSSKLDCIAMAAEIHASTAAAEKEAAIKENQDPAPPVQLTSAQPPKKMSPLVQRPPGPSFDHVPRFPTHHVQHMMKDPSRKASPLAQRYPAPSSYDRAFRGHPRQPSNQHPVVPHHPTYEHAYGPAYSMPPPPMAPPSQWMYAPPYPYYQPPPPPPPSSSQAYAWPSHGPYATNHTRP